MSPLESASAASRRRARTADRLQFPQDVANANNDTVPHKAVADARTDADNPSGAESSTDTAADRAASISVDNLAAAIANDTNAPSPAPTPLYTTVTDANEASCNLGDTKQMTTFVRAAEPDSNHV